jgi:hypothetical protein
MKEDNLVTKNDKDCEDCIKIKCRSCGWEPNNEELLLVNSGKITSCPLCGGGK